MFEPQCVQIQAENRKREREDPLGVAIDLLEGILYGLRNYIPTSPEEVYLLLRDLNDVRYWAARAKEKNRRDNLELVGGVG